MKTCKDCIHYECCSKLNSEFKKYPRDFIYSDLAVNNCNAFKDKSLVLDLPCKVGGTVYWYDSAIHTKPCSVNVTCVISYGNDDIWVHYKNSKCYGDFRASSFGKTVFLTREAAEQALKGGVQE